MRRTLVDSDEEGGSDLGEGHSWFASNPGEEDRECPLDEPAEYFRVCPEFVPECSSGAASCANQSSCTDSQLDYRTRSSDRVASQRADLRCARIDNSDTETVRSPMRLRQPLSRRHIVVSAIALAFLALGFGFGKWYSRRDSVGKYPEELVHARASDDIVNGGAFFVPPKASTKPVAVIWVHGWGVNFYSPTYVRIGRALADLGYPCVIVNTRMHDIGTVAGYRNGKRLRGGGYWGVPSEAVRDIASWIDFAGERGFNQVILVGHSFGWSVVRAYQGETQDRRVVGVVFASGGVAGQAPPADANQQAEAARQRAEATSLVADGRGDDLLRLPNRPFPSFISAATFLDDANTPAEYGDFFGEKIANPAVTRVRCPLLAFFGTREAEIGTEADLERIKTCIRRLPTGPRSVDTVMIRGADHMYSGKEEQVARTIATWADHQMLAGGLAESADNKR